MEVIDGEFPARFFPILEDFTSLVKLTLKDLPPKKYSLTKLKKLRTLKILSKQKEKTLPQLTKITWLHSLTFYPNWLVRNVSPFRKLTKITKLRTCHALTTVFKDWTQLTSLKMKVESVSLVPLEKLTNLRKLEASLSQIYHHQFTVLTNLTELAIYPDQSVQNFESFKKLRHFRILSPNIPLRPEAYNSLSSSLASLAVLENPTTLSLRDAHLQRLPGLTFLALNNTTCITDEGLSCLSNLVEASLRNLPNVSRFSESMVRKLVKLDISSVPIGDSELAKAQRLASLNIGCMPEITSAGIRSLSKLESLSYFGMPQFCPEDFTYLKVTAS
jgi:hypothetical protein